MSSPMSTHIPNMSGGVVTVVGEEIVDTNLRVVQTFQATFKANNFVPNEEAKVSWYLMPSDRAKHTTQRVVIRVEKSGTNDGLLGTNETQISWLALGE